MRTVVVAGASKEIGRASADLLAESGWAVIGIARTAPADFPGLFIKVVRGDTDSLAGISVELALRRDVGGVVSNAGFARAESFGAVFPI